MEMNNVKGMVKRSEAELYEKSFFGCLQFCKEFQFMPYMVSQRIAAFIWHTVANTGETTIAKAAADITNTQKSSRSNLRTGSLK